MLGGWVQKTDPVVRARFMQFLAEFRDYAMQRDDYALQVITRQFFELAKEDYEAAIGPERQQPNEGPE